MSLIPLTAEQLVFHFIIFSINIGLATYEYNI